MDDLINRQDAIDAIEKYLDKFDCIDANFLDGLKTTKKILNDLPSAESEQQWIPCKLLDHYYIKELKDCDNKSYLVTYKTKTGRRYVKKVNIYHGKIQSKVGGKVIAWMPLPDAYEEDK